MKRVPFAEIDGTPYRRWWCDRFAPDPDPLAALRFYQRGRNNVWVGSADVAGLASTRLDAVGLHLLRIGRRIWKPTSAAIVAFGDTARTNYVELSRAEARAFLAGEPLVPADDDLRRAGLTRGFIVVRYGGVGLGCGEWHGSGVLHSLLPASRRVAGLEL